MIGIRADGWWEPENECNDNEYEEQLAGIMHHSGEEKRERMKQFVLAYARD